MPERRVYRMEQSSLRSESSSQHTMQTSSRWAVWIFFCFLIAVSILYGFTLDTGLTLGDLEGGDLITHQYAQVQARPSNAPGYPLYTMGGWLWFHGLRLLFPDANPVPLLSSYSTLWAILALALFYWLVYQVTQGNLMFTVGFSAFYAVTYFFWYYAVSTEQYASAVLHTLLIVYATLAWDRHPKDVWLYILAFLFGVGLAHMVTVLFIAPGVLMFLLMKDPRLIKRGRLIVKGIVLAILPLLSYAYVYIRGAQHPEWWGIGQWSSSWDWFLSFLSTQQGRDELTWSLLPWNPQLPRLILQEITPFFLIVGVIGWWVWGKRHLVMFGLTAMIYLVFCYIDRFGNWYQVIMPLYPLFLLGAAVSFRTVWERQPRRYVRIALVAVLVMLTLTKAIDVYPRANQRNQPNDTGLNPGWMILRQSPPSGAAIVGDVGEKLALDYLTGVWGIRRDLEMIPTSGIAEALAANQPVLVTKNAASYAAGESGLPLRYTAWGPTLLLAGNSQIPPLSVDGMNLVGADVGDGLELVGFQVLSGGPAPWWVRLALRADTTPKHDWSISVRLLADGQQLAQVDHVAPALGFTPTSSLRPGDVVFDAFAFDVPQGVKPDSLRLIFYRPLDEGAFENLAMLDFPIESVVMYRPKGLE